jgi:hypothetical protein
MKISHFPKSMPDVSFIKDYVEGTQSACLSDCTIPVSFGVGLSYNPIRGCASITTNELGISINIRYYIDVNSGEYEIDIFQTNLSYTYEQLFPLGSRP